jgi:hypothetical protein
MPERIGTHTTGRRNDMTETDRAPANVAVGQPKPLSGWAGWVIFAGVMMVLLGIVAGIQGLVAIFDEGYYLVRPGGLVLHVDYTRWGWAHLVLGLLIVLAGLGVLAGNTVARIVGIVLAVLSAVVNIAFLAAYPIWSTIVIAIDVIVIYALCMHGRELRSEPLP